jgi:hypothetical protein
MSSSQLFTVRESGVARPAVSDQPIEPSRAETLRLLLAKHVEPESHEVPCDPAA